MSLSGLLGNVEVKLRTKTAVKEAVKMKHQQSLTVL